MVYQFKIILNDSAPRIWRRIQMPAESTFFELHVAIQNAMGWYDGHLHSFDIAQKGTAQPLSIRFPDPENDSFFGEKFQKNPAQHIHDALLAPMPARLKTAAAYGDTETCKLNLISAKWNLKKPNARLSV